MMLASSAEAQAATVPLEGFQQFEWMLGRWRGAGAGALAGVGEFHEEYVLVNDSTVLMRAYERAPFAAATDSTRFEYRNGRIQAVPSRGSTRFVTGVVGDTVVWDGGVRYVRLSNDHWRALFPPRANDSRAMYYDMRRMPPGH